MIGKDENLDSYALRNGQVVEIGDTIEGVKVTHLRPDHMELGPMPPEQRGFRFVVDSITMDAYSKWAGACFSGVSEGERFYVCDYGDSEVRKVESVAPPTVTPESKKRILAFLYAAGGEARYLAIYSTVFPWTYERYYDARPNCDKALAELVQAGLIVTKNDQDIWIAGPLYYVYALSEASRAYFENVNLK